MLPVLAVHGAELIGLCPMSSCMLGRRSLRAVARVRQTRSESRRERPTCRSQKSPDSMERFLCISPARTPSAPTRASQHKVARFTRSRSSSPSWGREIESRIGLTRLTEPLRGARFRRNRARGDLPLRPRRACLCLPQSRGFARSARARGPGMPVSIVRDHGSGVVLRRHIGAKLKITECAHRLLRLHRPMCRF